MAKYQKEAIEILRANPNVKEVREDRLVLTFECRVAIYEEWEKSPGHGAIRRGLEGAGIDITLLDHHYISDMHKQFKRHGCPQNGKRTLRSSSRRDAEADEKLLATGRFERRRNGIGFTKDFVEELAAKYPEQSIEEGLRVAGIDPDMVGYYRIYMLERQLKSRDSSQGETVRTTGTYDEETVQKMLHHPYVAYASAKQLVFRSVLYAESSLLIENQYSSRQILEIYEIPYEWMTHSREYQLVHRCRYGTDRKNRSDEDAIHLEKLDSSQQAQYIRIQRSRIDALEGLVQKGFEYLKNACAGMNPCARKQVCEWIRDDLPKSKSGPGSTRGILSQIAVSKSTYYEILRNDSYGDSYLKKEQQDVQDAEVIRRVIDYKGYPKGSRQVYMQMDHVTGYHMSRKKIMRLMQKNHWQSDVRKANVNRRAAQKHLKLHLKPNRLKRRFRLHHPGEVYLTDVTYMKYGPNGKQLAYGSASIDSVTGRIYTFQVSAFNDLKLVLDTLRALPVNQAYDKIKPILHSDQGSLYLTDEFQELVHELGMEQSMSKRGNCWDNACQESFFSHFKSECPYQSANSLDELKQLISDYCIYHNEDRGQWSRNKMTPNAFEAYLNAMSEDEFQEWQQKEEKRYEAMKLRSKEKAIERAKTLGV